MVVTAQPARGILAEAARVGADLLALATHPGTLHRLALGSTADKVVRAGGKPVLVARAGTEQAPSRRPPFCRLVVEGGAM